MNVNLKKDEKKIHSPTTLGIKVGFLFGAPLVLVFFFAHIFNIRELYLLPVSFIVSWILVLKLYKKVSKDLEKKRKK